MFIETGNKYGIMLLEWNHDYDHVHALMTGTPGTRMDVFQGTYKSRSTRKARELFPEVRQSLRTGRFWHGSYCLVSVGEAPLEALRRCIESQGRWDG
ncbi:MAG: IS200/IS605 family transposase [Deltaproteobacteria bacterium]|nr:IS200/IS605 family transposase [Deltaproteobacteria bacterium]